MTVITIMGKQRKITDSILNNTVTKLKSKGYLLRNGKLSETITRKSDIVLYLIYLWKKNKGKMNEVSNVRLSKTKIMKLMRKFDTKKIKDIVEEVNLIIYDENLVFENEFSEKDYEDMIAYLEDELNKCQKAINNVVIEPKVKFLTNGISIPKNSVSINFSSQNT